MQMRYTTCMGVDGLDWLSQLNKALHYLEDHLESEIDLNHLAKIACCSSFHFQRMFSYMAGVSLAADDTGCLRAAKQQG